MWVSNEITIRCNTHDAFHQKYLMVYAAFLTDRKKIHTTEVEQIKSDLQIDIFW